LSLQRVFIFLFFSSLLWPVHPAALHSKKTRSSRAASFSLNGKVDARQLRLFERQLTPFLEIKARNGAPSTALKNVVAPSQADLFLIARHWARLSASFKTLYTRSAQIPDFMKSYDSPGGHFKIFYATARMDSTNHIDTVDATDSFGFNPLNWRERTAAPNGVPDYIDEAAWAFDSAWSMEIDRFGFVRPLPALSSDGSSGRFKVITTDFDYHNPNETGYYGLTTPVPESSKASIGIPSYIEIRNQWVGWTNPDYGLHPEQGVRVTAAHEFFHSIQFSMTRNLNSRDDAYIDDFPLSWLEGTGALMENIAFDSINDYIQYSEIFFDDPTSAILNNGNSYIYTTVLLAMFLYERLEDQPSISFIKRMFFNNYNKYIDFFSNLDSTSKSFNRTWPDIFGDFFTQSYYSGSRARPGYFIYDAPLFKEWQVHGDSLDLGYSVRKEVPALGMRTFYLPQKKYGLSDGALSVFVDTAVSAASFSSVHCILQAGSDTVDSMFRLPVSPSGKTVTNMMNWSRFSGVMIVASNAQGNTNHQATVVFETCPVTMHAGDSTTLYGVLSAPLSQRSSVSVSIKAREDLSCSLSIRKAALSQAQAADASRKGLVPINVFYTIGFPATWAAASAMQLIITEGAEACIPLENELGISEAAFAIFKWDESRGEWTKSGALEGSGIIFRWQSSLNAPGIFGVFGRTSPPDSQNTPLITAYPNPVRKSAGMRFCADGKVLMRLLVYSMKGALVYRWETAQPIDTLKWSLVNTSGRSLVPGMYYAFVGFKDALTKGLKKKKQKVLIMP
jgi:hypothetical protein